jgi:diaminopimelate epimerase
MKYTKYHPDGSEAEKSGNGLRIFARYLWDEGLIKTQPFTVETLGGAVSCEVALNGKTCRSIMKGEEHETAGVYNCR